MSETFCGKSCEECAQREMLQCPGCKEGPGRSFGGDCELAQCCREKGHETCQTCAFQGTCAKLHSRDRQIESRQWKRDFEQRHREEMARRVPVLGRWLWILFWLVIPSIIGAILENDTVKSIAPHIYIFGALLSAACSIAYGCILLKLSSEEDRYRTAGICTLIPAALDVLVIAFSGAGEAAGLLLFVTIPVAIVALVGEYYEYSAHSAVLRGVDDILSDKWINLWKWNVGFLAGMIGGIVLGLIIPILGVVALLVSGIGLIVVSIAKLVYLYQTANVFRNYTV